MKNTISSEAPRSNVLQRVKWTYVSLAAGLAVAASAAVGLGDVSSGSSAPPQTATSRTLAAASRPAAPPNRPAIVFYLAESADAALRAEADEEMARWVRHVNGSPEPNRSVIILDASSEEATQRANRRVAEVMAAANFTSSEAPSFQVVTVR